MQWLTIEVLDAGTPASAWQRAYGDALIEAAVGFGCVYWDGRAHGWGVILELCFLDESPRDQFAASALLHAALDAAPDAVNGVVVYPHRGGGAGARVPRMPRPYAGAGAVSIPTPTEQPPPVAACAVPLRSLG